MILFIIFSLSEEKKEIDHRRVFDNMTGCCAVGCSNRSEKGYKLFYLPRGKSNEDRRRTWLLRIRRKDFKPTNRTALCEVICYKEVLNCNW